MRILVFGITLATAANAGRLGYNLPTPSGPAFSPGACGKGQVQHTDGTCVTPQINSRVFLFEVPPNVVVSRQPSYTPKPKLERNVILVKIPEGVQGPKPIVVPPPRQENVVLVLNKQSQQNQQLIELPGQAPANPEVYFVNYADGENPTLPIGVDLQTALNTALQGGGQVVGGGVGGGGGFGGGGGGVGGGGGGFGGGGGGGNVGGSYTPPLIPLPNPSGGGDSSYSPPSNLYNAP